MWKSLKCGLPNCSNIILQCYRTPKLKSRSITKKVISHNIVKCPANRILVSVFSFEDILAIDFCLHLGRMEVHKI